MIEGDCSLRSRSNVLVELLVVGSCEVSSAVQLRVVIAVQNNAGSSLVGVVVYCVDVDLGVTLNSAVQRVLDYVAANNSVAVLGPNLEFLRTVPDLVYMVISLISVGRLSSLEYVTVVNVGAALDAVVAEVNINNLSVVYAVGLVSQYGGSKYRGFLPIAQGLASDNLEAVSLVANEYGSVFVDCLNRTLNQLVVLNMVVANRAGEYVVVSRVAAVANNLQLVLVAGLGVGYDLNLSSILSGSTVELCIASSLNVLAIDSFGLLQGNGLFRAVSLQQGSLPLVAGLVQLGQQSQILGASVSVVDEQAVAALNNDGNGGVQGQLSSISSGACQPSRKRCR